MKTQCLAPLALALIVTLAPASAAGDDDAGPDGDGAEARLLTHGPTINAMPDWSPDGHRILFHSRRPSETKGGLANRKIWVMNSDGSDAHAISSGPGDEYHGSFSPDGARILMVSEASGSRDVWIIASDGTAPIPLSDDPGVEEHPSWSPGGERVVYTGFPKEGGNFDLWVVNSDGSGRYRLSSTASNELFPVWHPDGETLAYVTDATGSFDIYGMRVRDQTTFPIITGPDHDVRPAWSPDGTKLAFARWPARGRAEDSTLWIANADGTVPLELDTPAGATHPAWAPGGRQIAFQQRTSAGWDIGTYTLPPDLVRPGRLHLAQQLREDAADLVVLRGGDRLTGTVRNTRYRIRTAYATLDFPRARVAGLRFSAERGISRMILVNGDAVSGILLDDTIRIVTKETERRLGIEMLDSVGLRVPPGTAFLRPGLRFTMRNGDILTATVGARALKVRVAGQLIAVAPNTIRQAKITDHGARMLADLADGETVSGELATAHLDLKLALGPVIRIRPGQIRSIVGLAQRDP